MFITLDGGKKKEREKKERNETHSLTLALTLNLTVTHAQCSPKHLTNLRTEYNIWSVTWYFSIEVSVFELPRRRGHK